MKTEGNSCLQPPSLLNLGCLMRTLQVVRASPDRRGFESPKSVFPLFAPRALVTAPPHEIWLLGLFSLLRQALRMILHLWLSVDKA